MKWVKAFGYSNTACAFGIATKGHDVLFDFSDTDDITGSGADTQITIWDSATSITGNSNYTRDASNNISQGADTDVKNTIGRAVVDGGTINSDFAIFTHIDRVGSLNYAFMVSPNGSSYINAAGTGQTVQILDDNASVAAFKGDLTQLSSINVELSQYGSGTVTGTPTYNLSVDSAGKIIETPASQTGASLVYTQAYTAANLFTGGTQAFNVTGGVPVGKQLLIENLVYYLDYGGTSFDYISTDGIQIIYLDGFSSNIGPKINGVDTFMNTTKDVMTEGYFTFSASIFPHLLGGVVVGASPGSFELSLPTARPTVGNGTLYVSMQYKLLDTGASFSL